MASSRDEVSLSRRRRVTYQQLEILWEFLNSHRDVAVGYNKSTQAREYSKRMWVSVSESLNSLGDGATKDWRGWSTYWVDYKAKLKRRVAALRAAQNRTGGGPSDAVPLNDIEKKFISLLGEGFGGGLPNTQVDPFPTLAQPEHVFPEHQAQCSQPHEDPQPEGRLPGDSREAQSQVEVPSLQQEVPSPQQEVPSPQQEVPSRQQEGLRNVRRRSRQHCSLSQQRAREMLVDISRNRMLAEQQNTVALNRIAEAQEQNTQILQQMLGALNRIAGLIEK